MAERDDLGARVKELEQQVARLAGSQVRGLRYQSDARIGNLPWISVASGPDPQRGEARGHAKGIIAIGDMATGVLALGGLARGFVAIGGLALGVVSFGGLSIGAAAAIGGFALGSLAVGGGAVGYVAFGGGAAGYYACGGASVGEHVVNPWRRDPEAIEFFARYGVAGLCLDRKQYRP
jgi:hypothetical protein